MVRQEVERMQVGVLQLRLHIPWAHSLKEKRMVVKSLEDRLRSVYRVAVAETDEQDIHQIAVLGVACVAGDTAQADSILDSIVGYVETHTDAQLLEVRRELR